MERQKDDEVRMFAGTSSGRSKSLVQLLCENGCSQSPIVVCCDIEARFSRHVMNNQTTKVRLRVYCE